MAGEEFDYDLAFAELLAAGVPPAQAAKAALANPVVRPSRMQPPDATGVRAGQMGLPPLVDRNPLAGELTSTNTPMGDIVGAYDSGLGALTSKVERGAGLIGRGAAELTGVPQAVRAGDALGDALIDPSLANVTNAGTQAALAVGRPIAAAGTLGAGYLTAAAKDLGVFDTAANAQQPKPGQVELPGLTPEQNAEYNALQRKVSTGAWGTRLEANQTADRIKSLRALSDKWVTDNADSIRRTEEDKRVKAQAEYKSAVDGANERLAEDKQRAKAQNFYETEVGKLYKKTGVITPGVAAVGVGALTRATGGGMPAALGWGGLTGGMAANYPLLHNTYYQDAYNPEKAAYSAYARDLPPEHPRKGEWDAYAKSLPDQNPAQRIAQEQLTDPVQLMMRTGLGVAEGALGGHIGDMLMKIPVNAVSAGVNRLADGVKSWRDGRSSQRSSEAAGLERNALAGDQGAASAMPATGPASSTASVEPNVLATGNLAARASRMPEGAASAPGQSLAPEALSNRSPSEILGSIQRAPRDVPTSFPQSTPAPNPAPAAGKAPPAKAEAPDKASLKDKWDYDANGIPYWTESHGRIRGSRKMTLEEREMLGIEPKPPKRGKADKADDDPEKPSVQMDDMAPMGRRGQRMPWDE